MLFHALLLFCENTVTLKIKGVSKLVFALDLCTLKPFSVMNFGQFPNNQVQAWSGVSPSDR